MWRRVGVNAGLGGVWRCILLLDNHIEQKGHTAVGNDDALYRFRLGVFALAKELGNVRAACRMMGTFTTMASMYRRG